MVPGIFSPVSSFSHLYWSAYWSGVKLWISISRGQTIIPAGCCPVVRFTPATPADNFSIKISLNVSPRFSAYRLTNPKAVLSWIPAIVPARNTLSRPKSSSVYLWATAWSSPEENSNQYQVLCLRQIPGKRQTGYCAHPYLIPCRSWGISYLPDQNRRRRNRQ